MKKTWIITFLCIFLMGCKDTAQDAKTNQLEKVGLTGSEPFYQIEEKIVNNNEFYNGSKIEAIKITKENTKKLAIVGKIWGYLKYYHPNVAKGEYNWDYELFRVLPKVLEAENLIERDKILLDWIKSQGSFEIDKDSNKAIGEIRMTPDLDWILKSDLGDELELELINIRDAKRTDKNFYVSLNQGAGNPEFKNERAYKDKKDPDIGYRLLGLYRYWNIIEYYFPYKYLIEDDWDDVLTEFIPKLIDSSNIMEYKLSLLELISRVHDTHANIYGDKHIISYWGNYYAPVQIKFIENKAVVTGYFNPKLGKKTGLKIGDIITSINNKSIDEVIKERAKYNPASNYPTLLRNIANNLLRSQNRTLNIEFMRDNKIEKTQIKCYTANQTLRKYYAEQNEVEAFKIIESDIAYIYPGNMSNSKLDKIMNEVQDTKGLIIDFRCYPSDFLVFTLGEYLMPQSTEFVKFSNGSITNPGVFTMTDKLKVGKKNDNYYKGKVVIIINEETQSSAEYHTMAFRVAPRATVIGSTTAAADGNVSSFYLPGGIGTMITGIGVYYPDGSETQRIGIIPDIEIRPTIEAIKSGNDELLEKAIEIIVNED